MKTLTQAEWDATPSDYRLDDPPRVLVLEEGIGTCLVPVQVLDDRDAEFLAQRISEMDERPGPRIGDYVRFADGRYERLSHKWEGWDAEEGLEACPDSVQTSEGGSFYLGHGYATFSGGLNPAFPTAELHDTGEPKSGACWFFHHDHMTAHNGADVEAPFRVFSADGCRERCEWAPNAGGIQRVFYSDYVRGVTESPVRVIGWIVESAS